MSTQLEWSAALGRMTRTERVEEQGILTWDLVRTAILEGRPDEAITWLRYIQEAENYVTPGCRLVFRPNSRTSLRGGARITSKQRFATGAAS